MRRTALVISMLLSGSAALIYEIVWLRRLGQLLGQDVYAITVVLTVFFAGMGIGGWLIGRLADRVDGSIKLFIVLELLVAASAIAFDPLLSLLEQAYTRWSPAELSWQTSLVAKGLASGVILAVPTVAMGGTLPAMSRHVIRAERGLAGGFGWLYGANTLGAAAGVFLATFALIPWLGVGRTMRVAAFANAAAAGLAWWGGRGRRTEDRRHEGTKVRRHEGNEGATAKRDAASRWVPLGIAFATGFVSVGFEVLWTRGLSTRFISGVYSLAVILGVYLLCIALGSLLVAWFDRRSWVTPTTCAVSLILAGLAGVVSPALIARTPYTTELIFQPGGTSFASFELAQLLRSVAVMAGSLLMFGLILPMVVRLATRDVQTLGTSVGAIYLVNSTGAVIAPLTVGFLLMPAIGLSGAFVVLGGALVALSVFGVLPWAIGNWKRSAIPGATVALVTTACAAAAMKPDIRAWKSHPEAVLVDYREGVSAAVSVVDHPERGRVLQVNLGYTLGGSRGVFAQRRQGLWPFLLQRNAERALVLGLGTGCTAAAAYQHPGVRLDALEIVPDVFPMLRYYEEDNFSLVARAAQDANLRLLSVDARHFVRSTDRRYDVVIGDLFEPWRSGVGAMYTREHFEAVQRLLTERGTFWQWLPLYQLGDRELKTIARTFCVVFDHVEVWWLEFNAEHPAIALVGTRRPRTVDLETVGWVFASDERPKIWTEAGFLGRGPVLGSWICGREALRTFAGDGPLNTVDKPLVEFGAPRSLVDRTSGWGVKNMHKMFELTESAGADRASIFADEDVRREAERYAAAIRGMLLAHERQMAGSIVEAVGAALDARRHTPEWTYPTSYVALIMTQALDARQDRTVDRIIGLLSADPTVAAWANYWRGRRAVRDQQPYVAQTYLRKALATDPHHDASARLLAELERRYGRRLEQ